MRHVAHHIPGTNDCRHSVQVRLNKKYSVFRVNQPYLNLLVNPKIFFRFSGKIIFLYILKAILPFKMHKILFYPEKNIIKKSACLSYLKYSDPLPKTHLFFIWPKLLICRFMPNVVY